jgi:hypothetical protein
MNVKLRLNPEDGGDTPLRNVCNHTTRRYDKDDHNQRLRRRENFKSQVLTVQKLTALYVITHICMR